MVPLLDRASRSSRNPCGIQDTQFFLPIMLNISAIITHPISHVSLCFLLLVTNLITLDTVQPSEKFSVRYFTSSQTSNITSFPQLNYSLIQKAPNIQKQYLIIFSVTDLFYAHFPLKPFKKIYFSARSHKHPHLILHNSTNIF